MVETNLQQIPVPEFVERLHSFFSTVGQVPVRQGLFDSIYEAVGASMKGYERPLPDMHSADVEKLVRDFYDGNEACFDDALQDVIATCERFRSYQKSKGCQHYLVWSEAFYDDPNGEEVKVFKVPVSTSFSDFVEKEDLSGLMAAADTVLLTEDFANILVIFHHAAYYFYDREFADSFLVYIKEQEV